jgi:methionyl-tRNA formyltransferase
VRVLFWGTPEFAVPALRALIGEGFDVVGVVTQPDRPVGRSRSQLQPPPVKVVALEEAEGIIVLQPERPRGDEFRDRIAALEPDISVVVAYGHILPKAIVDLPRLGTINIHASLLPKLRGAAPIQAAIREGMAETGVTIMRMVPALDAGPTILEVPTPILEDETYGELSLRLSEIGALACVEALALIDLGRAEETPQDESEATYAPKVDRDTTRIDWSTDAFSVSRTVRAYDPRPGALTSLRGQDVKMYGAKLAPGSTAEPPGTVIAIDESGMTVACGEESVLIGAVQPAGKRRMSPRDWALGRGVSLGDRFGTDDAAAR